MRKKLNAFTFTSKHAFAPKTNALSLKGKAFILKRMLLLQSLCFYLMFLLDSFYLKPFTW